ncbi:hypothetical protein FZW96_12575 [Bacillus sp. BGMRC 2118]|nr:hypothetical protein FZW96_12575 [Bacillus sp. BGMRC 2118]
MKLTINENAAKWYIDEMNVRQGEYVRFFVRYGGTGIISGFSLGVSNEWPVEPGATSEINGVTFYIEEKDLWYFDGHELHVKFNEKYSEPEFDYVKK